MGYAKDRVKRWQRTELQKRERGFYIYLSHGIRGFAENVGRNAQELLRRLEACRFAEEHGDEVCPANWKPGEETLKPSLDLVGLL